MSETPQPGKRVPEPVPNGTSDAAKGARSVDETVAYESTAAAPVQTPPLWQLPGGRYQVVGEIARGGMGVVLRAIDVDLQRPLAVKVMLDVRHEERFLEEARITGQLQHPGIPPVHEIGRLADGRPFFAMKLIEGRTLAEMLQERCPTGSASATQTDLPRFLKIFEQIAQTLAYAHSQGIIHRDLKPLNVMVGAFGEVQVMDWGLARRLRGRESFSCEQRTVSGPDADRTKKTPDPLGPALDAEATKEIPSALEETRTATPAAYQHHQPADAGSPGCGEDRLTRPGQAMGTPAYMPPEQARGEIEALDERADVFGLGAILCEILTGRPPYVGHDRDDVFRRAQQADLADALERLTACGADAELIALANTCLALLPAARPHDAGVVAAKLTAYLESVEARLRQAELERAQAETKAIEERKRRKMQLAMVVSLLALVGVAGIGGWWVREQSIRRQERALLTVDSALAQLVDLQHRALWKQGEALLDQAGQQIGAEADPTLRERVAAARTNLRVLARLDRIRQEKAMIVEGRLLLAQANPKYAEAFREFGFDILNGDIAQLSQRLKDSSVREELIATLDDWALDEAPEQRQRLDQITAAVTGERWREELSQLARNPDGLRHKAQEVIRTGASPALFARLAGLLGETGQDSLPLLEAACRLYPSDFWLHFERGQLCDRESRKQYDRAVGAYQAALAVQPESQAVWTNLGEALRAKQDLEGAVACQKKAIELDPKDAKAHYNLGNALHDKRDVDGAIACYQRASELDPKDARPHIALGNAFADKQDLEAAIASYKKVIELDPKYAPGHYNLGIALADKRDLEGAIASYKRAVDLDPKWAEAHCNLGLVLREQGAFREALEALQRGHELGSQRPGWRYPSAQWVRETEQLVQLDSKLPALLKGELQPANTAERLEFIQICHAKKLHAGAALVYTDAFAAEPKLADDLNAPHRYNAARSAALAGCGQGKDAAELDEKERAGWRKQALDWLRADLKAWTALFERDPQTKDAIAKTMTHWQTDRDLAGVRDEAALKKLPADEQSAWRQFWADVGALRKRAGTEVGARGKE